VTAITRSMPKRVDGQIRTIVADQGLLVSMKRRDEGLQRRIRKHLLARDALMGGGIA